MALIISAFLSSIAAGENETKYFAVFLSGQKAGHAKLTRMVDGDKVVTTENLKLTVSRANIPVTMKVTETCIETIDGKPLGFQVNQDFSLMQMRLEGQIEGNTLHITTEAMGGNQETSMPWPEGALMAEGIRLLSLEKGLAQGTTYDAKLYSPGGMQAVDVTLTVGEKENVDLLGRVVPLTKVTTLMKLAGAGEMKATSYVDDKLELYKNVMPAMGLEIEMVACSMEFALSEDSVVDIVNKMFIKSPQTFEKLDKIDSITYELKPNDANSTVVIPASDNQTVTVREDGVISVTVTPLKKKRGDQPLPYAGEDPKALEALKPNRYVQSDDPLISELAKQAIGDSKDAYEAAKKIETFVANHIENKGLSVGYASASEVAQSRQGDCTEFSVLTAAMCQAAGIPARVVMGVAYIGEFAGLTDQFGGHAWTEVFIEGQWVGLDASFKSSGLGGYDAGHIMLASGSGEPETFFSLVGSMGLFTIEKATVNE